MPIDLAAVRLALSIPAALSAWAFVALLCVVLRLRDPRLRSLLAAVAIVDALCAVLGLPCLAYFFFELRMTPAMATSVVMPIAPYALAAWAGLAGGLVAWRLVRVRRIDRLLTALAVLRAPSRELVAAVRRAARAVDVVPPEVVLVPGGGSPFVAGWRRPRLVVPEDLWRGLDGPARRALLLHEMVHVRRHDNLRLLFGGLLADVFFFNWPLRRLIARWLREREAVADLVAVRQGASALGLAQSLLASLECGRPLVRAGLAMSGGRGSAAQRVRLVARPPRRVLVAVQVLALALLVPWNVGGWGRTDVRLASIPDGGNGRVAVGVTLGSSPLVGPLVRSVLRATQPQVAPR